jgi:alkanesulfonate monooxygenase
MYGLVRFLLWAVREFSVLVFIVRGKARMTQFHWRIPIHGCKGDIATPHYTRGTWGPEQPAYPYHDYLLEVARAAEISGFDGALIPSFPDSEDPWVIASSIARHTKTLRFMIAYQPCWLDPMYAAKMSASLQRLSGGRLLFNIITGGGGPQQLWWGDRIAHDDRYTRTTEFLDVLKGVWNGGPFSYNGKFFQIENAGLPAPLTLHLQLRANMPTTI